MNAFKRIVKTVSTILVGLAVVLAVALVGVRLFGLDAYAVLSGSMEPTYKTGSVIWVADREPEEIEVGDPITFVLNEDLVVATHRVIEIDAENQHFYTQGDANDAPDGSPVHFENLIGEPVFTVPYLGYLVNYVQSPPGCYIAVTVCAVLLLLMFLPDLFAKDEEEKVRAETERREKATARDRRAKRAGAPSNHDARRSAQSIGGPCVPKPDFQRASGVQPVAASRVASIQIPRGQCAAAACDRQRQMGRASKAHSEGDALLQHRSASGKPSVTQVNNPRLRRQMHREDLQSRA